MNNVSENRNQLEVFERDLLPNDLSNSQTPATVLGYGEISTVFALGDDTDHAYKRMPLFDSCRAAEVYADNYRRYCGWLKETGLTLPEDRTEIIEIPGRPVVLYIVQKQLSGERFAHQIARNALEEEMEPLIRYIVAGIGKVWRFNAEHQPELELAIDGQLSNWVLTEDGTLYYIDTSTPLFRLSGEEQLDPELFLKSAPGFLRWIIRWLFLKDVMNRYYESRQVFIDLAANLYKEQRPDLVPLTVEIINRELGSELDPLKVEEIEKYYKEDKFIWTLFLAFRRFDRWLKTTIFRKRYEFILPGKIER